jgi:hypothetical protein
VPALCVDILFVFSGGVSVGIAPFVRSVVALDSARGMIDKVQNKVTQQKLTNVTPLLSLIQVSSDFAIPSNVI